MAINNFKPFALDRNANVTSQADWEALPALLSGFTAGKASSAQVNKAIRQASFIAAALAQYTANKSGLDVLDDGDLNGFISKMGTAFRKDFQALDATLSALAGLATGANKLPYFTGNDTASQTDLTSVGRDIIGKGTIADILTYLGLTYYADKRSLANQEFSGPVSSKDSVTATSADGTTRKISLNATNGLQIVIYDGGQYRGAINVPTKAGTMALTSDLANFADKLSASEQSFTGPVSSGEGLVAKYGAAKIILSAQNGQRIVVYTNDTYRGAINIPLRDGTMALLDDVTNVSATLLGISQSWQNVKANRTAGVTYTNSTSRPIAVSIAGIMASRQTGVQLSLAVNGTEASSFAVTDSSFDIRGNVFVIVPPGATYNLTASNINSILTWSELR